VRVEVLTMRMNMYDSIDETASRLIPNIFSIASAYEIINMNMCRRLISDLLCIRAQEL